MNHATTENTIKKIQSLYNEKRSLNDMIARFKRNLLKMESENALDPLKPFLPIQIEKCKFLIEDFTNDIEGFFQVWFEYFYLLILLTAALLFASAIIYISIKHW